MYGNFFQDFNFLRKSWKGRLSRPFIAPNSVEKVAEGIGKTDFYLIFRPTCPMMSPWTGKSFGTDMVLFFISKPDTERKNSIILYKMV